MVNTLVAITTLLIASGPAFVIFAVLFVLLGGDAKAVGVILLVFFGTVAAELTEISGCKRIRRYQLLMRRPPMKTTNRLLSRWEMVWWVSGEYKDQFLKNLPGFFFRLLSWALLAVAGVVLVKILGS